MDLRREELEKKRAKLAELRRQREERKQQHVQSKTSLTTKDVPNKQNLNSLVDSLINSVDSTSSFKSNVSPSISEKGSLASTGTSDNVESILAARNTLDSIPSPILPSSFNYPSENDSTLALKAIPQFSNFSAVIIDLPPKEKVFYSKEVQVSNELADDELLAAQKLLNFIPEQEVDKIVQTALENDLKSRELAEIEKNKELAHQIELDNQIKFYSEEKQAELSNDPIFVEFIEKSTKLTERALDEDYDFTIDYTLSQNRQSDNQNENKISHIRNLYSDAICKNRSVTDISWSGKFGELVVVSYNRNTFAPNEPDGIVAVWNMHLQNRPEFVFQSPSDVLKVIYNEHDPNMLIGSTYSGQIMIWDTREKSFPVLKTLPGTLGHSQPVYSMKLVGTKNAHQLASVSTDGLFCSWQLDMLAQPIETVNLVNLNHNRTDEIGVTCIDFADNETSTFWVGSQEGDIFNANRYDRYGIKAGIISSDSYKKHTSCVTSIQTHPQMGSNNFSDIVVSSSFDYSVNIWKPKSSLLAINSKLVENLSESAANTGKTSIINPVHTIDAFDDYVYDAKWSPSHPSLLATADGTGNMSIFDLNKDTQMPVLVEKVNESALNKLVFNKSGKNVAVGSIDGKTSIYDLAEVGMAKPEDYSHFSKTIEQMCAQY
ncbi:hypothetical protein BB561_003171 [Smittium simulii]|uniref:Dynein intermediate chain, cytosolic n=1 Tax=Smittium simulii TaxID=133385 RepID=A0A2T9YMK7_9FUNG|nr:hypothetical protein BB561_003171 [Smittium simulii]